MSQRKAPAERRRAVCCLSVVDPGTTRLRTLIAEVRDAEATVWGWHEVPALAPTGADAVALVMACEEALAEAERMARERAGRFLMADQIVVGLPGSQLRGRAWTVTQRRARPERPVDERELSALLERALRLAVHRLADDLSWRLVDAVVAGLTVDGRSVTDPCGFRGGELGATVFAALAPAEQVENWYHVARQMEFSALVVAAAPIALAAALPAAQAVLVDVGGASTDITHCRLGRPAALESLPVGGGEVTRSLVQKWGLSPEKAERLKRLYTAGDLPDEGRAQVREAVAPAVRDWLQQAEAVLSRLNQDEPLPQRLVLLGGGSAVPEVTEAVRTLAWSERLHFARHPEVDRFGPAGVPGVVNRTGGGREPGSVAALALAAWAARQAQPQDRPARLLAELCREG